MPRDGVRNDSDSTEKSFAPSRRSYLKAAGAAAVSVPLLSGEGAAATERHGISFDNVVDMVEAGADPNGNEACDGALKSAAGSNTLLKFPSGTYKFTEQNVISGGNVGILGEGDVTFTVPENFDDKLLAINGGTGALVENITIDQSGATPNLQVAPDDGLEVHDVTITGQSLESSDSAEDAFTPMVRSSGGEGTVSNLVAHNEGRMGAYARTGVWIGAENEGTITLRNCNVEGFSNNGVYASRTPGVVKIEGGTYKNNDLSQVRIGSSGSYVDGATLETDVSDSRSPNPEDMLNGSGIRLESDRGGSGAVVRNCDVRVGPEVSADGGIQIFGNYGDFTIEDTRVEYNPQGYSIRAKSGDGSGSGTFRNVSVTGDATDWVGVLIEDRPGTTVEGCCIQQTGSGRTGLALDNCDGSTVTDCTINASAQAIRINGGGVSVSNIEKSGTCPAPSLGSSSYDGSSSDDSSTDDTEDSSDSSDDSDESSDSSSEESTESSDSSSEDSDSSNDSSEDDSSSSSSEDESSDSSGNDDGAGSDEELSGDIEASEVPEPSDSANFVVTDTDSSGGRIPYEVQTSGDIEKAEVGDATQDSNDEVSGKTASGGVNEWRDAYEYEGELVALETGEDGHATIKLDESEGTITVMGDDDSGTDYSLEVTGTLEHADDSTDPIADDGHSVSGGVGTFRDEYSYTGRLVQASIGNSVSITTDPDTLEE